MSTRVYECPQCKKLISLRDTEDETPGRHACPECHAPMKHIGTVGTTV